MFEELLEAVVPGGVWLAAGVALGAAFGERLRPVAKEAIKLGMTVAERAQGSAAELYERAEDLIAEARHERAQESARETAAPRPPVRRATVRASRK